MEPRTKSGQRVTSGEDAKAGKCPVGQRRVRLRVHHALSIGSTASRRPSREASHGVKKRHVNAISCHKTRLWFFIGLPKKSTEFGGSSAAHRFVACSAGFVGHGLHAFSVAGLPLPAARGGTCERAPPRPQDPLTIRPTHSRAGAGPGRQPAVPSATKRSKGRLNLSLKRRSDLDVIPAGCGAASASRAGWRPWHGTPGRSLDHMTVLARRCSCGRRAPWRRAAAHEVRRRRVRDHAGCATSRRMPGGWVRRCKRTALEAPSIWWTGVRVGQPWTHETVCVRARRDAGTARELLMRTFRQARTGLVARSTGSCGWLAAFVSRAT